jgi:hypothetical protein
MNKVKRVYNKQPTHLSKEERHKNTTKEYYKRRGQLLVCKKNIINKLNIKMEELDDIHTIEELYLFLMNYMKFNGVKIEGDDPEKYYKVALKIY